ncbi:MAG: hypothetical protein MUF51_02630 [Vicinamibacteria bacterium]|nr:hypothetical protein [Vicinamibacteria bacterium]
MKLDRLPLHEVSTMRWKNLCVCLLMLAGLSVAQILSAEGTAIGGHASTTGLGVSLTRSLIPSLNLRGQFGLFSYTHTGIQEDIAYEGTLSLRSYSLLADFHPGGYGFHLTAGLVRDENHADGIAEPAGTYTINGHTYNATLVGRLTGKLDFPKSTAPYLGLGFGNAVGKGKHLTLHFEWGVMFQGTPQVKLNATGPIVLWPEFQRDLAQLQQDINDDLQKDYFKYYPVITLGLAYRF